MPLEAGQRGDERAIAHRGKARHAHVDPHGGRALRHGLLDLALREDAGVPATARATDRDALDLSEHAARQAQAQPAELGQEDSRIGGVELDLLGVGVAKACTVPMALEARELRSLGEEDLVGPLQVLESLLLRMHGRIGQPCGG